MNECLAYRTFANIVTAEVQLSGDPVLSFGDREQWAAWLDCNFANSGGVWLQMAKKGSSVPSVSHTEALEVALCYGWIDAQTKKGPEGFWVQRFMPRSERSIWSKVNRAKALELIAAGMMKPAGLAAIECAKRNGRWDGAYDAASSAEVPDDLAQALRENLQAGAFFEKLNRQNRYAILFRLQTAKRPETRARRLKQFVDMLAEGKTLHPQK